VAGRVREATVRGMIGEILASHADAEEQVWPGDDCGFVNVEVEGGEGRSCGWFRLHSRAEGFTA